MYNVFFAMNSYLSIFLLGVLCFFGWLVNRAGHPRISAVILIAALLIIIQYNIFQGYGIHDVGIVAWPAIIFFAGLMFSARVMPYFTALTMLLAVATKVLPNAKNFTGYADTGDLVVMLLIMASFSLIGVSIIRSNEQSILALRESETIFASFMEYSPVYIFFKDQEIRSLRLSKCLGCPSVKCWVKRWTNCSHPTWPKACWRMICGF